MPKCIAKEAQRRPTEARAARPEGCGAFPGGVRWTTADRPPWGMPLSSACPAGKIARNAAHATFSEGCSRCYRKDPFPTDRSRVEFLFALYEHLTAPLVSVTKPRRARKAEPL